MILHGMYSVRYVRLFRQGQDGLLREPACFLALTLVVHAHAALVNIGPAAVNPEQLLRRQVSDGLPVVDPILAAYLSDDAILVQ